MTTLPRLDPEVFTELYESLCEHPATVASLYDTFLDNAARLIAALRTNESRAGREKTLHTLKGSAAMMGASRVAQLAADLQLTSATLQGEALRKWIDQIDTELGQTRLAIDARLASLGTSRPPR